jgi:hypothetical protein
MASSAKQISASRASFTSGAAVMPTTARSQERWTRDSALVENCGPSIVM